MNRKVVMHPFGWMAISAFSMVICISASIALSTSDRWWQVALSKLSAEPFGFIFSLGFVSSACSLAIALHLQLRHMNKHWAGQYWRLYALRWLLLTLCAGLTIIGIFPDMDPWLTPHRLGGWLCVISATLISLGVYVWLPPYPPIFKRFSVMIGILPYIALTAYVLRLINFTTIELFLLMLGAIWMSVFYAYTRVFTGAASPDILVEGGD